MAKKGDYCCSGCKVESVIPVDGRGQVVLPKEIREKAGIKSGDKLALVTWERDGRVCCIALVNAGDFEGMVKEILGPMAKELLKK